MEGEKKKVLVVDDDSNFLQLLQATLEEEFEVYTAPDGLEGLKMAVAVIPDLIIVDVIMPNVSGVEMARMLLDSKATGKIPVIIMTGSQMNKSVTDRFLQERNVVSFVHKTVSLPEIVAAAKKALSRE